MGITAFSILQRASFARPQCRSLLNYALVSMGVYVFNAKFLFEQLGKMLKHQTLPMILKKTLFQTPSKIIEFSHIHFMIFKRNLELIGVMWIL